MDDDMKERRKRDMKLTFSPGEQAWLAFSVIVFLLVMILLK